MVEAINKIKNNLKTTNYNNELLKLEFYAIVNNLFDDINDYYQDDLSNIAKVLEFLIFEVLDIYASEESNLNNELINKELAISTISDEIEDGRRGLGIYLFNDTCFDNYIIGDIHSDSISLNKILSKSNFFERVMNKDKFRLIFLGDYVDRGKAQLKTFVIILLLKCLFPEHIYLLKGNHDQGWFEDGFVKMGVRKPEADLLEDWFMLYLDKIVKENETFPFSVIENVIEFFANLATLAFIVGDKNILLSHGGIPRPKRDGADNFRYLKNLADLVNEDIVDELNASIILNMLWSDPTAANKDEFSHMRRFEFTQAEFDEFRSLIDFDMLIRGHQVQVEGYKYFFNKQLLNIFSSGIILEDGININNESAYLMVNPHIIKIKQANLELISLND